jgi:NAD dependent epimerase/dehydratase
VALDNDLTYHAGEIMILKGKKVLVTGAGGFIGSHLSESLTSFGCEVIALLHYDSRMNRSNLEFLPAQVLSKIDIRKGDICDPYFMMNLVKGCHVVFHLAALIGIPYSYISPLSYVATNMTGTANVLQACLANDIERIIHTSTSECYGTARYVPIDESHPLQAQSPYAATKIGADKLAESYHRAFGLPVSIIRPFNTFGPRQSSRAVIPTILSQLISGLPKVRLGSVEPVRDMNYVQNVVDGFLAIASCDKAIGEVINVGSGIGLTVREIARHSMTAVGHKAEIEHHAQRSRPDASEVDRLICDSHKAKALTGWMPVIDFQMGLTKTIEFIREHPSFYLPHEYSI